MLTNRVDRCKGMLAKGVDGCRDIASRMTVIDNFSRMTVVDDELWLKYSLRRCLSGLRRCLRM